MEFTSLNPANGQIIERYQSISSDRAHAILQAGSRAYAKRCREPWEVRAQRFTALAACLRKNADEGARLMALEMGKPLAEGLGEIEKCAKVCDYFAEKSEAFLARRTIPTEASASYVTFQPLGGVLAIMPWNFPFWQVFRVVAPTIMAGNAVYLKHAPNVTGCALLIEKWMRQSGFSEETFGLVVADLDVTADMIAHPAVNAVTLTGSTKAGRSVGKLAGAYLKPVVLELGGSDPYLILEDADIKQAAHACVASRLINGGQSCIAAKRFIVVAQVKAAFTEAVYEIMKKKTYGDPLEGAFDIGPMARQDLRDELHRQVEAGVAAGAKLLLGGTVPAGPGYFYPPSLLTDVTPGSPPYCEELFGPVATIISAANEAEAVQIANQSDFGLGAAVFTADVARGERLAREELKAGACFVNDFVRSDQRLPFGGIKDSGHGRELSDFGIREFVNVKTVWVR